MSVRKLQLLKLWEADTKADLALSQATPGSMLLSEKLPGSVLLNQRICPRKSKVIRIMCRAVLGKFQHVLGWVLVRWGRG